MRKQKPIERRTVAASSWRRLYLTLWTFAWLSQPVGAKEEPLLHVIDRVSLKPPMFLVGFRHAIFYRSNLSEPLAIPYGGEVPCGIYVVFDNNNAFLELRSITPENGNLVITPPNDLRPLMLECGNESRKD